MKGCLLALAMLTVPTMAMARPPRTPPRPRPIVMPRPRPIVMPRPRPIVVPGPTVPIVVPGPTVPIVVPGPTRYIPGPTQYVDNRELQQCLFTLDNESDFNVTYRVDGQRFFAGAHTTGAWWSGTYANGNVPQVTFTNASGEVVAHSVFDGQAVMFQNTTGDEDVDLFHRE